MLQTRTVLCAATVLILSTAAWAREPVRKTVAANLDAVVEIDNIAGSVKVVGWERGEVEVSGRLGRSVERLDVDGGPQRVRVRVVVPQRAGNLEGSEIEVRVPEAAQVVVETVSADISTQNLAGRLKLESVSGGIRVAGSPAALDATTVSGDIDVPVAPQGTRLESVSGEIEVGRASGELQAATVSGSVRVTGGTLQRAELESTSGAVRLDTGLGGPGLIRLESMSGRVVLVVPEDAAADFALETFSGDILNQLGPAPRRTSSLTPGKELHFSTGSGGPRVVLSSFSGTVELRTR